MFKDNTKTIQTNRLILRKFTITDADDMYNNWASDTECCKYLAWNVHKNIDETKALLEAWIKAYDEGYYNWVVEIKNTHEIIGSISVMTALEKHSTCELGYCYGSKYWGNGYAMDVMQMDAFEEIKNYTGRVCIVHGTKDKIVDVSYANRAAEAYKSTTPIGMQESKRVQLHFIDGGGHMFSKKHDVIAMKLLKEFAAKNE